MEYKDILNKSWDEVQEQKVLPVGSYLLVGRNATLQEPRGNSDNPTITFVHQPKEAMDDVDEAEFAELGDEYDITENRVFTKFWIETSADLDKARKFLNKCGVDTEGKDIVASLKDFKGTENIGYLSHRAFETKEGEPGLDNTIIEIKPLD